MPSPNIRTRPKPLRPPQQILSSEPLGVLRQIRHSPELLNHRHPLIRGMIQGVDLPSLCRVGISRITQKALPHIGLIELVSGPAFSSVYDALYTASFPKRTERERSDLIVDRLNKEFANERSGLAPYRIVGIRDVTGAAIGAAQFSVLPLSENRFAVPYLQYIYVRPENRRQDMSEVLYMMILAVATADASPQGRSVPFTLFETDPPGHGHDDASRAYALERAMIHTKGGSVAMMLRRKSDGTLLSPHVQPGLEVEDPPLSLVWVIKKSPSPGEPYDVGNVGENLVAAYYQSLRDEGFPEKNIQLAEDIVRKRSVDAEFILMPLAEVKVNSI